MVKKVLMVCLGNTCRSPIAEAVMKDIVNKSELQDEWIISSAGIENWHVGSLPNERALNVMCKRGLSSTHRARQITAKDFEEYDYIFGMDEENMADLRDLAPNGSKAKLLMLGNFGIPPSQRIIEDPYCQQGENGFVVAYDKCTLACNAFLKDVFANKL